MAASALLLVAIVLLLACAIGIVLGMLGGGGAILMVPMPAYVAGPETTRTAIATSVFVVGTTGLAATILQARAQAVRWRTGASFAVGAVAGAFARGSLAHQAHRIILRRRSPVFDDAFHLPTRKDVDMRLVAGAALFGVGWGLGGYCPGPGIVAASSGALAGIVFLVGMSGGVFIEHVAVRRGGSS